MIYHPSPFYGRTPSFSLWITFLFDKWLEFSVWIFSPKIETICHFPPLHLGTTYSGTQINGWICLETQKCKIIVWLLIIHISIHPDKGVSQGGKSYAIYALFGRLRARKGLFWVKTVFLGQKVHYYKVCIAYYTE